MADKLEIVDGWTGNLDFELTEDDAAIDLTGDTIVAESRDKSRKTVTLTGDLAAITATAGTIRLNPDTGDFSSTGSPYELRFKRTLNGGGVIYYPNGEAVIVEVRSW